VTALATVETEQVGSTCVVRMRGEIDLSNAQVLSLRIEADVPNSAAGVVIDLSETSYLDSSGVALLVRLGDRLRPRRQPVRVVAPAGSPVRAVLEIAGVPALLPIDSTIEESARASGATSG